MTTEATDAVEVETRIRARPETIFAFFTEPELYHRWKGDAAELDPRPGGIYRVSIPGRPTIEGTYLVVEPPRRLVFTWGWVGDVDLPPGSSRVEVTLAPAGDETVVRVFHSGLPTEWLRAQHADGWHYYLGRLGVVARGGDPGREIGVASGPEL